MQQSCPGISRIFLWKILHSNMLCAYMCPSLPRLQHNQVFPRTSGSRSWCVGVLSSSSAATREPLHRVEWESLEPANQSHHGLVTPGSEQHCHLLRDRDRRKGRLGQKRVLDVVQGSAVEATHPLQTMKALLTLCQSDNFPPQRKFLVHWNERTTTWYGSSQSCRERGLLMVTCIQLRGRCWASCCSCQSSSSLASSAEMSMWQSWQSSPGKKLVNMPRK